MQQFPYFEHEKGAITVQLTTCRSSIKPFIGLQGIGGDEKYFATHYKLMGSFSIALVTVHGNFHIMGLSYQSLQDLRQLFNHNPGNNTIQPINLTMSPFPCGMMGYGIWNNECVGTINHY